MTPIPPPDGIRAIVSDFVGVLTTPLHGIFSEFQEQIGIGLARKQAALRAYIENRQWFKREDWADEIVAIERRRGEDPLRAELTEVVAVDPQMLAMAGRR